MNNFIITAETQRILLCASAGYNSIKILGPFN